MFYKMLGKGSLGLRIIEKGDEKSNLSNEHLIMGLRPQAAGGSIPASEHSTITSWGVDGECDAMRFRDFP